MAGTKQVGSLCLPESGDLYKPEIFAVSTLESFEGGKEFPSLLPSFFRLLARSRIVLGAVSRAASARRMYLKRGGTKMRKLGIIFMAVVVLGFAAVISRAADEYPNKPIQLIVPYGAGGLTDSMGRLVAEKMGKILGTSILVVNKPGAASAIGSGFVAASAPGRYQILINMTGGIIVTPLINPNIRYKMSDLKPIGKLSSARYLMLASRELPVKTLPELIAYAKKNPGKLSYA